MLEHSEAAVEEDAVSSVAGQTMPVTTSREPVTAVHQGSWEKRVTRVGRPHVPGLPVAVDTYLEIVISSPVIHHLT